MLELQHVTKQYGRNAPAVNDISLTLESGVIGLIGHNGRATRTARTFLALFLFGLYLAMQIKQVPWWDVVGFNGVATPESVFAQCLLGCVLCAVGAMVDRRRRA